jgi:hypothetical protein
VREGLDALARANANAPLLALSLSACATRVPAPFARLPPACGLPHIHPLRPLQKPPPRAHSQKMSTDGQIAAAAGGLFSAPRRFLGATDIPSEVVLTDKGYNALWVGFAMCLMSTMYFVRASVHSHSKVRDQGKGVECCGRESEVV